MNIIYRDVWIDRINLRVAVEAIVAELHAIGVKNWNGRDHRFIENEAWQAPEWVYVRFVVNLRTAN